MSTRASFILHLSHYLRVILLQHGDVFTQLVSLLLIAQPVRLKHLRRVSREANKLLPCLFLVASPGYLQLQFLLVLFGGVDAMVYDSLHFVVAGASLPALSATLLPALWCRRLIRARLVRLSILLARPLTLVRADVIHAFVGVLRGLI